MSTVSIRDKAGTYVTQYFKENISTEYYFHSSQHVKEVVESAIEIAESYQLSEDEIDDIAVAAWFHDIGIEDGYYEHEKRSAEIASDFLNKKTYDQERIQRIQKYILATRRDYAPQTIGEKIMKDADTAHIGKKSYFEKLAMLKTEWEEVMETKYTEKEWFELNLEFLNQHRFYTPMAQSNFNKRKRKNITKLNNRLASLIEFESELPVEPGQHPNRVRRKSERGIETMFRVTLRNHNHLSRIADNKANIMLSINAIMLSIVISSLSPKIDANPSLIIPTIILIMVTIGSILLATLATMPKITAARYSDEKFLNKQFNILFFGNFYRLPLDKFEWGINELMEDQDLLYSSLAKDLYYLGLVLAKKYRYLRYCYNFFVVGLCLAALAFIIALVLQPAVSASF